MLELQTECRQALWKVAQKALLAAKVIDEGGTPLDLYKPIAEARSALESADMLAADAATNAELAKMKKRPC